MTSHPVCPLPPGVRGVGRTGQSAAWTSVVQARVWRTHVHVVGARRAAQDAGSATWPCNVGFADGGAEGRSVSRRRGPDGRSTRPLIAIRRATLRTREKWLEMVLQTLFGAKASFPRGENASLATAVPFHVPTHIFFYCFTHLICGCQVWTNRIKAARRCRAIAPTVIKALETTDRSSRVKVSHIWKARIRTNLSSWDPDRVGRDCSLTPAADPGLFSNVDPPSATLELWHSCSEAGPVQLLCVASLSCWKTKSQPARLKAAAGQDWIGTCLSAALLSPSLLKSLKNLVQSTKLQVLLVLAIVCALLLWWCTRYVQHFCRCDSFSTWIIQSAKFSVFYSPCLHRIFAQPTATEVVMPSELQLTVVLIVD